jgi:hypothetical protein
MEIEISQCQILKLASLPNQTTEPYPVTAMLRGAKYGSTSQGEALIANQQAVGAFLLAVARIMMLRQGARVIHDSRRTRLA